MELAIAGLGRMGGNMARRLHKAGIRVVAYNRSAEKTKEIMAEGLEGGFSPTEIVEMLTCGLRRALAHLEARTVCRRT